MGNFLASPGLPSFPMWQNYQFATTNHYGFFILHTFPPTIAFKLIYVLFYQFHAKISAFATKKYPFQLLSPMFKSKPLAENDVKTNVKKTSGPPVLRRHFLAPVSDAETRPEFPWTWPGPGNVVLQEGVTHCSTVARTVMYRQDGRGRFPVFLDDLSKCRTNSQRKSQLS